MSRSPILLPSPNSPADTPTSLVDDVIAAAWDTVDTLPGSHLLRVPLVYAVWALEDAVDAGACVAVALPVVIGLVAATTR